MAQDLNSSIDRAPNLASVTARLGRRFKIRGLLPWGDSVPYLRADSELGPLAIAALPFECASTSRGEAEFYKLTRRLSSLNGAGLPVLLRHGNEDGVPFLAFRSPSGQLLSEHLAGGRVPSGMLLRIADTLLSALGKAHAAGLVHGELSPDSVLVDARSPTNVVVTLLGLGFAPAIAASRLLPPRASNAAPTMSSYRAPEILAGEAPTIASDLYAVGAIVHHMVAGRAPRGGAPAEPYTDVPALLDIVRRALGDAPATRFVTAESMRGALQWVEIMSDRQDVTRQDIPAWMEQSTVGSLPIPEFIRRSSPPPSTSLGLPPLAPSLSNPNVRAASLPPPPAPVRRSTSSFPPPAQRAPSYPPAQRTSSFPPPAQRTPSSPPSGSLGLDALRVAPFPPPPMAMGTQPRVSLPPPMAPRRSTTLHPTTFSAPPPPAWSVAPIPTPRSRAVESTPPAAHVVAPEPEPVIEVEVVLDDLVSPGPRQLEPARELGMPMAIAALALALAFAAYVIVYSS